jgi:hypothetical protein
MTVKRLQIKKRDTGHKPPQASELTDIVMEEDRVRLNVEITKSKRQALKARAAMEGQTVHQIVNRLVDDYLKQ